MAQPSRPSHGPSHGPTLDPRGEPLPATNVVAGAARLLDYWLVVYRRTWRGSVISSFVSPLLYVVAMGVLLGGFIAGDPDRLEGATSYLAFVVPGMLAAQTMTLAFGEVTYPVMGMLKWHRTYFSMTATSLGVPEVVLAHLAFVTVRVALTSAVFLAVMVPFGVLESVPGTLAAWPVQLLLGLAFAAPVYAYATGLRDESSFSLVFRLGLIPLFLFSGAFFPIANLAEPLETLARLTPLWHGVDLTRMLVLGRPDAALVAIHLAYLAVLAGLGWWWALRRLTRRMVS